MKPLDITIGNNQLMEKEIPDNWLYLGKYDHNKSLKAITLPLSIGSIGAFAFCKCKNLEKITIIGSDYTIFKIGEYAYMDCENLKEIKLECRSEIHSRVFGSKEPKAIFPCNIYEKNYICSTRSLKSIPTA